MSFFGIGDIYVLEFGVFISLCTYVTYAVFPRSVGVVADALRENNNVLVFV